MLKCYGRSAEGCTITDPPKTISIPGNADMFVNDNTLMHNNSALNSSAIQLMQMVQHDSKLWGRLLW
eukprot:10031249-Ditylum_brightwellii.AAC.1